MAGLLKNPPDDAALASVLFEICAWLRSHSQVSGAVLHTRWAGEETPQGRNRELTSPCLSCSANSGAAASLVSFRSVCW